MDWIKWDKIMESLLAQEEEFVVDISQQVATVEQIFEQWKGMMTAEFK